MPDAYSEPGRVQWEAPSNRKSGKFKDTHPKRLRWWKEKAKALGIDTTSANWISRTAREIHPTKEKPCKICGTVLDVRYLYPNKNFLKRAAKLLVLPDEYDLNLNERVTDLLARLYDDHGQALIDQMPKLLAARGIKFPVNPPDTLDEWLRWIETEYIPREPSVLGPGVMANPPDRFDGLHSDNRCCRAEHDKGRSKKNLASYVTDRRVFEYWTQGNWIAADRLMGIVRSEFRNQPCRNGHEGPCDADHIGPISLGFTHRPCFQSLCTACNSGKNNRMYVSDVELLKSHEAAGEEVISWHAKKAWDLCKLRVDGLETAQRLSKILRDNRHTYMSALRRIAHGGHYLFLSSLLELHHADYDAEFANPRIENFVTVFDEMKLTPRTTKYAIEQKARRCRIAFGELNQYFLKKNRNEFLVSTPEAEKFLSACLNRLGALIEDPRNERIAAAVLAPDDHTEVILKDIVEELCDLPANEIEESRTLLQGHMELVGEELAAMWNDDRYVRT